MPVCLLWLLALLSRPEARWPRTRHRSCHLESSWLLIVGCMCVFVPHDRGGHHLLFLIFFECSPSSKGDARSSDDFSTVYSTGQYRAGGPDDGRSPINSKSPRESPQKDRSSEVQRHRSKRTACCAAARNRGTIALASSCVIEHCAAPHEDETISPI